MLGKALESEFHQFFRQMTLTSWIGHFLAIAVFGVVVPFRQGLEFLDVMFLLAYACLPCLFAAPLVAESVAARRALPPEEGYLAQVLTPYLFSTAWSMLILGSALGAVNAAHWYGRLLLPPTAVLANIVLLSLSVTWFAAAATGWLSLNVATAAMAKAHARRLFLLILVLVLLWMRMGPVAWRDALTGRLTAGRITGLLLPVSLVLAALGFTLLRMGARRRREEDEGPLLRLQ